MLANDEVLDIGGKRLHPLDTPHVPHNWEAGMMYEENTGTLAARLYTVARLGDGRSHLTPTGHAADGCYSIILGG